MFIALLYVSGNYVPITRRKSHTYGTPDICHSIWMTGMQGGTKLIPPCIPDSHLCRVTNIRCRIGTVFSPDDGHILAQNMVEKSNKHVKKNCAPSWFFLQDLAENL
jgi:hypothetical protein